MPRPRKWRRVCCLPETTLFGSLSGDPSNNTQIVMSIEEYETIRLIDLENLTQEECSDRMDVARTTVQRIYNDARKKIADALVNGKQLKIEGGDYLLCNDAAPHPSCPRCRQRRCQLAEK